MTKCPFCAEEIQDEAVKCKHCQSMLVVSGAPSREKRRFVCVFLDAAASRNKLYLEACDKQQIEAYSKSRGWTLVSLEEKTLPKVPPLDISGPGFSSSINSQAAQTQSGAKVVQARSSVEDGVRLGCGMFIVLPLVIIGIIIFFVMVLGSVAPHLPK